MAATMELILKHNFEIQITDKSLPKCHQTCNFPLHDIYTISNVHMSVLNNNGIYIQQVEPFLVGKYVHPEEKLDFLQEIMVLNKNQ